MALDLLCLAGCEIAHGWHIRQFGPARSWSAGRTRRPSCQSTRHLVERPARNLSDERQRDDGGGATACRGHRGQLESAGVGSKRWPALIRRTTSRRRLLELCDPAGLG